MLCWIDPVKVQKYLLADIIKKRKMEKRQTKKSVFLMCKTGRDTSDDLQLYLQ